jgi:hypothetical protein
MEQRIDLVRLKGIRILYADDLYDLGQFVLKAYDAPSGPERDRKRDQRFTDWPGSMG